MGRYRGIRREESILTGTDITQRADFRNTLSLCLCVSVKPQKRHGLVPNLQNKTPGKTHFFVGLKNVYSIMSPSPSCLCLIYRSAASLRILSQCVPHTVLI